jgi:hypothetical protein
MTRQIDGKFRPWCQGQLQAVLPYLMDSVVYLYVDTVQDPITLERTEVRRLLTRATSEFEAGERVGGTWPLLIDDPNITMMISDIFDTKTEPTKTTKEKVDDHVHGLEQDPRGARA